MFVLRFHNTYLLRLGILGLILNLTFLSSNAIASDSDSETEPAAIARDETPEAAAIRLEMEYQQALNDGTQNDWADDSYAQIANSKEREFVSHLIKYPPTMLQFRLDRLSANIISPLLTNSKCRNILRSYRTPEDNTSLIQLWLNRETVNNTQVSLFNQFINYYLADTGEISAEELDLKAPVDFNIFNGLSREQLAVFSESYSNQDGQNILHLIPVEQFDAFADRVGDDDMLSNPLVIADSNKVCPLHSYIERDALSPRIIRMLTSPTADAFNATQLTYLAMTDRNFPDILAALHAKGVDVNHVDDYGNTAERVYRAKINYNLFSLVAGAYVSRGLNESLWHDIRDKGAPYITMLKSLEYHQSASKFSDAALLTVQSQPQTPLHRAFWQLDTTNPQLVAESKDLWRSFSETCDSMSKESDEDDETALPLSGRVLNAVSSGRLPDLQETRANIISGASSFGVRFGKATAEEAEALVTGIRSIATSSTKNCLANAVSQHLGLGDSITKKYSAVADHLRQTTGISDSEYGVFDQYTVDHRGDVDFQSALDAAFAQEANVIQRMFFKSYHKSLDKDKADRLLKHQLKSTVAALYMLSRECVLECGYERFKSAEGGADEDKIFDYINVTLKDRMPTGVNASALCQNIKDHFANPDEVFF